MDSRDIEVIRKAPLFSGLSPEAMESLLRGSAPRSYAKGRLLFEQGEAAAAFFIVLDGWVNVFRMTPQGDEAVFGVFTIGQTFGEAAMFIQGEYPAGAQVVEDARLIAIRAETFLDRLSRQPDMALSMLAAMSKHLHSLVNQVDQLQTRSSAQRLAQFLVSLAPVASGSAVVALPYDKSLIAHRLGMKPESLSRAFARLRGQGITADGSRVLIGDVESLREYGESGPLRERLADH